MRLTTHLSFGGQCEAAFRFYEKCLGAKVVFLLPWGESPMAGQAPVAWGKKLLHATLAIGDVQLSGADIPAGMEGTPQGFALTLHTSDPVEAERVFAALGENGKVTLPLQGTFWALLYGCVVDQFGIPWMINCEKPG
jgi:PhnB protein